MTFVEMVVSKICVNICLLKKILRPKNLGLDQPEVCFVCSSQVFYALYGSRDIKGGALM